MNHGSASRATITDLEAFLLSEDVSVGGGDAHGAVSNGGHFGLSNLTCWEGHGCDAMTKIKVFDDKMSRKGHAFI